METQAPVNVNIAKLLGLDYLEAEEVYLKWKCLDIVLTMLESGVEADITFETAAGGSVKAHKGVLACASPVFFDMFSAKEQPTSTILMADMDIEALQLFLFLVYTRNLNDCRGMSELNAIVDKHVVELSKAARKYDVEHRLGLVLIPALARKLKF